MPEWAQLPIPSGTDHTVLDTTLGPYTPRDARARRDPVPPSVDVECTRSSGPFGGLGSGTNQMAPRCCHFRNWSHGSQLPAPSPSAGLDCRRAGAQAAGHCVTAGLLPGLQAHALAISFHSGRLAFLPFSKHKVSFIQTGLSHFKAKIFH